MRPPALGLLQNPAPRAGDGQGSGPFAGVGDLQPAGQDRGAVQLGMNLDGDWSKIVPQGDDSLQASGAGRFLFQADPLPVRGQELPVDLKPEGLRHRVLCRVDSAVIEAHESRAVPTAANELALSERFLIDHPPRAVTDGWLRLLDEQHVGPWGVFIRFLALNRTGWLGTKP